VCVVGTARKRGGSRSDQASANQASANPALALDGLQRAADGAEYGAHPGAQAADDRNAGNGDQAGDHRVFKCGDAANIGSQAGQYPADLLHYGGSLSCV
jgi:hypothetical protein